MRDTVPVAELAGKSTLIPAGAAALALSDNADTLLAVEVSRHRVLLVRLGQGPGVAVMLEAGMPLAGLALHAGAGVLAAGAADGRVVLHDVVTGDVLGKIDVGTQALTALSFCPDGKLLAAGDGEGQVMVYRVGSGEEVRRFDAGEPVGAVAVDRTGTPIVVGTDSGQLSVRRRLLPPLEFAGQDQAVTALAVGMPGIDAVAGRSDGTIEKIAIAGRLISPYLTAGAGPVRAVAAGSGGRVVAALTGDGQLCRWVREQHVTSLFRDPPDAAARAAGQVWRWWQELRPLVSGFADVREQMRAEIAEERADMLSRLAGLDDATRDRIRPVVIDSAVSIYTSYSFDLAVRRVFRVNPLPAIARGAAIVFGLLMLAASAPSQALQRGHHDDGWLAAVAILLAGMWAARALGRMGAAGRLARAVMVAGAAAVAFLGPEVMISEPRGLRHWLSGWFPAAAHVRVRAAVPYPVWAGLFYLVLVLLGAGAARLALRYMRAPSALEARRRVLGGSLLHALLDVAYRAQLMADDPDRAASRAARWGLHQHVRLAAGIACGQWVAGLRIGSRDADRMIREQGRAIAAAIARWERDAVLGGVRLPALSQAFTTAVVNAADGDWGALSAGPAQLTRRRRMRVAGQGLALAVPLGAAAGIVLAVRPLPSTLVPLLTFLTGLGVARVLRWLDFGEDIDPGLKLSELMRKPG